MNRRASVFALVASFGLSAGAAAVAKYVPTQDLDLERLSATSFRLHGTNTFGEVDVKIEDKHLFQGFSVEGKQGESKVEMEIKSAGLGAGWRIEGKIGDTRVEGTAKQDGAFAKTWTVKGKVGDREFEKKVDTEWEFDPAVQAIVVVFDCCDKEG